MKPLPLFSVAAWLFSPPDPILGYDDYRGVPRTKRDNSERAVKARKIRKQKRAHQKRGR